MASSSVALPADGWKRRRTVDAETEAALDEARYHPSTRRCLNDWPLSALH
jgi:hypothetical protein